MRGGRVMRVEMLLAVLAFAPVAASAQMEAMPEPLQERLAEIGPGWGSDIGGNVAITQELYTPLLAEAPRDGVEVVRDLSYGPDDRNILDIYMPEEASDAPVVVFLH